MNRRRSAITVGVLLALGAGPAAAAQLDYAIDAGAEDNDNIALTESDEIRETLLRAGLGFLFTEDSSLIQASVGGRLDYRDYRNAHLSNQTEGNLAGRFNWSAIPQRLDFTVEDVLDVQSVSTLAPDTPDNRQQVNVVSAGPTLYFKMGPTIRGQAEARFVDSDAEVTDEFNSQRTGMALRAIKDLDPTSLLSLNLQEQRIDFDNDLLSRDYDRDEAFVHYASKLRVLDLNLDAGYTRLRYRDGQSVSESLLRGGVIWRPSQQSRFDLSASRYLSDSASASLTELVPGVPVQDTALIGNSQVTSSAYLGRNIEFGYAYTGALFSIGLHPFKELRDYVDPNVLDQDDVGARFDMSWRLRRDTTLTAYASQDNTDYTGIDRKDKTRYAGVALQKQWSRHWGTRLDLTRYDRTSTLAGQEARQNVIYLSVTYKNR